MATNRGALIETLRRTHPTLVRLTAALPDAALDFRPAPAEWNVREVLAHLVDDEMKVMRLRMERIVTEDHPHLAPYDEKQWYATRNTARDARDELLADFDLQRAASLGMLDMLCESDWAREGYQPEYGAFSAESWLEHWVEHDTTHLGQVEATLGAYDAESAS
jgi:hypothetical protein